MHTDGRNNATPHEIHPYLWYDKNMHAMALYTQTYEVQALVAALAVGLVCAVLSVLVVLKRMAFIGQGISHAGFGGVGTAALLGFNSVQFGQYAWQQDLIVFLFCLATAVVIAWMTQRRRVETDTAIGILMALTMAWGAIAQNLRVAFQNPDSAMYWPQYTRWVDGPSYSPPWEAILFGSILNVGVYEMWIAVALAAGVLAICAAIYKELLFFTFDETVSRVFGVRTALLRYLLLVMLCVVVVVSIRLVGLILVSAMLVIPGAAALLLSRKMRGVITLAILFGTAGAAGGLTLSLIAGELSPGGCIVATLSAIYAVAYFRSSFKHRTR